MAMCRCYTLISVYPQCQLFGKYSRAHCTVRQYFHYPNANLVDSSARCHFPLYLLIFSSHFMHCHLLNAGVSCCYFFFLLFRFTLNLSLEKNSALRRLEFFNINSHTSIKLINHTTDEHIHSFIGTQQQKHQHQHRHRHISVFCLNEAQWKFQMERIATIENKNSSVRKFL